MNPGSVDRDVQMRIYDGCFVELRDGSIRGPVSFRPDVEPHMRPWINGGEAWFDNGGYRIQGGDSPWDIVRVLPAIYPGLEHAISVLENRLALYTEIGQVNAIREAIGCLRSAVVDGMSEDRNAVVRDLRDSYGSFKGSHDWIYGEKRRLETALARIAECAPESTKEDLMLIARNNLPTSGTGADVE